MNGQLSMFDPKNCGDSSSVISSPGSADGATHYGSPDGQTTDPSGPGAVPASPSVPLAKGSASTMTDTSGPHGFASSQSAALQSSLESRLKQRFDTVGSTLFALTWKEKATPSGRSVCLLRALGHHIFGNGCGSWPSPKVSDDNQDRRSPESTEAEWNRPNASRSSLPLVVKVLAPWRSPAAQNADRGGQDATARVEQGHTLNLQDQVTLASWPTPNTPSGGRSVSIETMDATGRTADGKKHTASLEHAVKFTAWATPAARDFKGATEQTYAERGGGTKGEALPAQARGLISSGSPAETVKLGQLNPAFSRWLMGYPPAWDDCAATAMPSSRKSQPK